MQTHSRYRKEKPRPSRLGNIIRRFRTENMMQTSAALAFTTLMALVPLVAVVLSVASAVPYLDLLILRLDLLIQGALLPSGAAGAIAGSIGRFSHKAQALTVPSIAALSVTAFLLLNTIERAFNHLWQVKPRSILLRLKLYGFVMIIWPFVLGAVAGAMSFAVTVSLGFVDEPEWMRKVMFKGLSILLLGMFFTFLYYAVPNAQVPRRAALMGGIFATAAFSGMQKIFELYLVKSALIKSIYGAFAAFPVFLIWLHLSWVLVLLGGLIAVTMSRPARH
jgi:membrane protein